MVQRLALITANVGSVFENMGEGLSNWMDNLTSTLKGLDVNFVSIHFQETGGKNYLDETNRVGEFFERLSDEMFRIGFRGCEGFVDSQTEVDQFTALSNVYFFKEETWNSAAIYDFKRGTYEEVGSKSVIHYGESLVGVSTFEKEKFPQNFFPDCKWSRKGFLRTRWRLDGVQIDFVNIHLFHDVSNVEAKSEFPSAFAKNRQRALEFTLTKLDIIKNPTFIFGDFNFRLNTEKLLSEIDSKVISIGPKEFEVIDHEELFKSIINRPWLRSFDFEGAVVDGLSEEELTFHPTYPFSENVNEGGIFLRTRCPAWCDRVLYNNDAKKLIGTPTYDIVGKDAGMGDHKPVYLVFELLKEEGASSSGGGNGFSKYKISFLNFFKLRRKKNRCKMSLPQ